MSKLFVDNGFLARSGSLLKHLEKGDTLAVEAARVPYLELSDIARDVEGFTGRTDRSDNSNFSVGYFEPLIGENFVLFGPSPLGGFVSRRLTLAAGCVPSSDNRTPSLD